MKSLLALVVFLSCLSACNSLTDAEYKVLRCKLWRKQGSDNRTAPYSVILGKNYRCWMRKGGYVCTREREQRWINELIKACDALRGWFFWLLLVWYCLSLLIQVICCISCQIGTIVIFFQVVDWVLSWLLIHPWCVSNLLGDQEAGGGSSRLPVVSLVCPCILAEWLANVPWVRWSFGS